MIHTKKKRFLTALLALVLMLSCWLPSAWAERASGESAMPERVVPGVLTDTGTGGFRCEFSKNGELVEQASFVILEKLPSTDANPGAYRQIYWQNATVTEKSAHYVFDGQFYFLDDQIACPSVIDEDRLYFPLLDAESEILLEVTARLGDDELTIDPLPDGELICATKLYAADFSGAADWYLGAENTPLSAGAQTVSFTRRSLGSLDQLYSRTFYYAFILEDEHGEMLCPPRAFDYRGLYLAEREPGESAVVDCVLYADHVAPEMLEASYWLQKTGDPDAVIMTPDEIEALNRRTLTELISMHDLDAYPAEMEGEALKALIEEYTVHETAQYSDGAELSPGYWAVLDAMRNTASIGEKMPIRYGVVVRRANGRAFPTADFAGDTPEDRFFDNLQAAELYPGETVLVLHESVDGQWLFVLNEAFGSWVRREDVALCADKSEWSAARNVGEFLVVTADRFRLDADPYDGELSAMELDMGVILPLADPDEWPETIGGRDAYGNYIVKLARRAEDGSLMWAYAPIPVSKDVTKGFMPYTTANVLGQAFKLLGSRYGWGGSLGANDCSGYARQVYAVFGIRLPRNSGQQSLIPATKTDLRGMTIVQKAQVIDGLRPGALLQFPGHIMFYLGEESGFYYVISSAGSFIPLSATGEKVSPASTILINDLTVTRKNHLSWFESLATAVSIEP